MSKFKIIIIFAVSIIAFGMLGIVYGQQDPNLQSPTATPSGSLFGNSNPTPTSGGLFGSSSSSNDETEEPASGGLFGSSGSDASSEATEEPSSGGLFGGSGSSGSSETTEEPVSGGLFGDSGSSESSDTTEEPASEGLFGNASSEENSNEGGLFGGASEGSGESAAQAEPCVVVVSSTDRIDVRTGPGTNRSIILFLEQGEYEVINNREASDGSLWYELDKAKAAPGQENAINQTWIPAQGTTTKGDCNTGEDEVVANPNTCKITVGSSDRVDVRTGPGSDRSIIRYLDEGEYDVFGQTETSSGSIWYKLDKAKAAPSQARSLNETWVPAHGLTTTGDCENIVDSTPVPANPVQATSAPTAASTSGSTTTNSTSPTATSRPRSNTLQVGGTATTTGQVFAMNAAGSTIAVDQLPAGATVDIIAGPVSAGNKQWWRVITPGGSDGWIEGSALKP